ncbi:HlyD family secretion protein [Haliovirga abyssi]|uniref:HlyD family efflux transporter periplasmic adaptor subunit n=1 Tax=Haliovirga abyssi TaxID=2996794 RepID=A0AAU9DCI4_9FUSO|nr:HlyD family efflux transporter periplasmic adaptor subunit [Haliovirga abyssi]BDU51201.1 hypothetical protein HLVA_17700 [Haliovirga abyssi]
MKNPLSVIKFLVITTIIFVLVILILFFVLKKTEYVEGKGVVIADKYNIYSPCNGRIKKIEKGFGEVVNKKEIVMEIDSENIKGKIIENERLIEDLIKNLEEENIKEKEINLEDKNNENKLKLLEIDYKNLKNEYEHDKILFKMGEISNYELKKIKYLLGKKNIEFLNFSQKNDLKLKKELIYIERLNIKKKITYYKNKNENLKNKLNNCNIASPYDRMTIITNKLKNLKGAIVNNGDLLFTLADLNNLKMLVTLKENQIEKVKKGQKVILMIDAIPYEKYSTLEGEVIKLFPQAEKGITYNKVEVKIKGFTTKLKNNRLKGVYLRNGLKGKAKIIIGEKKRFARYLWDKLFE